MTVERAGNGPSCSIKVRHNEKRCLFLTLHSHKMMPAILDCGQAKPGKTEMSHKMLKKSQSEKKNTVGFMATSREFGVSIRAIYLPQSFILCAVATHQSLTFR